MPCNFTRRSLPTRRPSPVVFICSIEKSRKNVSAFSSARTQLFRRAAMQRATAGCFVCNEKDTSMLEVSLLAGGWACGRRRRSSGRRRAAVRVGGTARDSVPGSPAQPAAPGAHFFQISSKHPPPSAHCKPSENLLRLYQMPVLVSGGWRHAEFSAVDHHTPLIFENEFAAPGAAEGPQTHLRSI